MRSTVASLLLLASVPAAAAQTPAQPAPSYAPIVIEQADYQAIEQWLGEQPMKFAAPVQNWLNTLEQKAQADKAKAVAPVPESKGPPAK